MVVTSRVRLDRIASCTRNLRLSREVMVGDGIVAQEGYALAVRVLTDKSGYNTVEDVSGRMMALRHGDVLAGVLGARRALRGYAGVVPSDLRVGDVVQILNLGGVLGHCISTNPELGPPFDAEVLGAILSFPELGDRIGRPATISENAIGPANALEVDFPIVYVAGTCMNAGKTVAATELVRGLSRRGRKVAAVKLTGVSLMRDTLAMRDAGAVTALTFNDAGLASTHPGMSVPTARGLLNQLGRDRQSRPDVVIAELGDGILGEYGVQDILMADDLMALGAAHVMAAPDPVGCWGALQLYRDRFHRPITVFTGPATDNEVGRDYIRGELGLPAFNARLAPAELIAQVESALEGWEGGRT